jgi:predicted nucleic acid-binding protein
MPAKVVDASVMGAWFFRESRAMEALRLIGDSELHAPYLLGYELTSIARGKTREHPEKAQVYAEALRMAFALPIFWSDVDHHAVLRLALETGLTTYDACYLYLALKLNIPLVTFDERLAKVAMSK